MSSTMPRLAACFLVQFDNRKGYTLAWHRSSEKLGLEGTIEFKCLPSGLHNVQEDLVYFIHEGLTGVAAFYSAEASVAERNARFVSVGILASGEDIWTYSSALRKLASKASIDEDVIAQLEQFWRDNSSLESSNVPQKVVLQRNHELSGSASLMLDSFGPLLFPMYKACLLRQRVLLIGQPPMLPLCEFVNLLSTMSTFPSSSTTPESIKKLPFLYTVGVHDIPALTCTTSWSGISSSSSPSSTQTGYIACTSDSLLSTKPQLSDVRLTLSTSSDPSTSDTWPTLVRTNPTNIKDSIPIKATQRDLSRWELLQRQIIRPSTSPTPSIAGSEHSDDENDRALLLPTADDAPVSPITKPSKVNTKPQNTASIVEPPTWSSSLNKWSASTTLLAEAAHENDEACLRAAEDAVDLLEDSDSDAHDGRRSADLLTQFFRGQSKQIFNILQERLASSLGGGDGQEDEGYRDDPEDDDERAPLRPNTTSSSREGGGEVVKISRRDMINMGLDVYSTSDAAFITELARLYFDRKVEIEGAGVEVCGVRIY